MLVGRRKRASELIFWALLIERLICKHSDIHQSTLKKEKFNRYESVCFQRDCSVELARAINGSLIAVWGRGAEYFYRYLQPSRHPAELLGLSLRSETACFDQPPNDKTSLTAMYRAVSTALADLAGVY